MRALIGLLVVVICVFSVVAALADEVETSDGRVFSGVIRSGIPEFIKIDVDKAVSTINRDMIRLISYASNDLDVIETINGTIFEGKITSGMPDHIIIDADSGSATVNNEDVTRIMFESSAAISMNAGNPWDYFWLEGLAGTFGAAGGVVIVGYGAAMIVGLITEGNPYAILATAIIGQIVGGLAVPIISVNAVGKAHDVRGNLGLAFVMEVGGGLFGLLLDSAFGTPLIFSFLGTGYGAAVGYNIGAEIVTQRMAIKQGEIQLLSIGMQF